MVTTAPRTMSGFLAALLADTRSPDIPARADVYGWFVGDWELDILRYWAVDVAPLGIKGSVHAAWVLGGRAVQDVFLMPRLPEPAERGGEGRGEGGGADSRGGGDASRHTNMVMHGSTVRAYDPSIDAWRISWRNPAGVHFEDQIGRRIGDNIVQLGARADGTPTRWMFAEITPDSFHWLGHALEPDGRTWRLEGEFRARRLKRTKDEGRRQ